MIYFCLVTLGGDDLVRLAIRSIQRYVKEPYQIHEFPLADPVTPASHGQAINVWRTRYQQEVKETDYVVIMDPDVAILSPWWQREATRAFDDPTVGIWGAGASEDFRLRVHASMMVIRGSAWKTLDRSFTPCTDPRERDWRDTGGLYCMFAKAAGWKVVPVERGLDWHGVSAWYAQPRNTLWGVPLAEGGCRAMWAHLGGGTWSDPTRMTRWQRIRRRTVIRQRRQFISIVQSHMQCS